MGNAHVPASHLLAWIASSEGLYSQEMAAILVNPTLNSCCRWFCIQLPGGVAHLVKLVASQTRTRVTQKGSVTVINQGPSQVFPQGFSHSPVVEHMLGWDWWELVHSKIQQRDQQREGSKGGWGGKGKNGRTESGRSHSQFQSAQDILQKAYLEVGSEGRGRRGIRSMLEVTVRVTGERIIVSWENKTRDLHLVGLKDLGETWCERREES